MRVKDLFDDFSIDYVVAGHRHATLGWINTHCPFCIGSRDYHLGYNIDDNYFHCWRCGGHGTVKTLMVLLNMSSPQVKDVIRKYGGVDTPLPKPPKVKVSTKTFKYPSYVGTLQTPHRRYLESRGFDPDEIATKWFVAGTGPVSRLDDKDYSHRIIAPIHWPNKVVSFQGRTIKPNATPKYKACPKERELIHHQNILYGMPRKWTRRGICVEGITDVWRLGYKAFATFGIQVTIQQIRAIKDHFDEVVILFDPEPQAQKQARKLKKAIGAYGVKGVIEKIETDPGSMSQDDANHLIRTVYGL